jgi:hypothetical protein
MISGNAAPECGAVSAAPGGGTGRSRRATASSAGRWLRLRMALLAPPTGGSPHPIGLRSASSADAGASLPTLPRLGPARPYPAAVPLEGVSPLHYAFRSLVPELRGSRPLSPSRRSWPRDPPHGLPGPFPALPGSAWRCPALLGRSWLRPTWLGPRGTSPLPLPYAPIPRTPPVKSQVSLRRS